MRVPADAAGGRRRIVIVGGGFGGLAAARKLHDADVDVTLIDRRNHHLFQPLLYQAAARRTVAKRLRLTASVRRSSAGPTPAS